MVGLGLIVGISPGKGAIFFFLIYQSNLPVDSTGKGYSLGVVLGRGENQLPQGEQPGIQVNLPIGPFDEPLFEGIATYLDLRKTVGRNKFLEREEHPQDSLSHFPVIITGEVEGNRITLKIDRTEFIQEYLFQL